MAAPRRGACPRDLIVESLKLGFNCYEVIMLMSASANVGICQMVNPLVTVKVSIPTSVLKIEQMD